MEKSHFIQMGVEELLWELLTNEKVKFGYMDMYKHISNITNNFELQTFQILYDELKWFVGKNVRLSYNGKLFSMFQLSLNYINGTYKSTGINYEGWNGMKSTENELKQWYDFVELLQENNKIECEYRSGTRKLFSYIYTFNAILEKLNIDIVKLINGSDWLWKLDRNQQNRFESKQPLTFTQLFRDEYKEVRKMELFYSRLKTNGFIDEDKIWRNVLRKLNEPAKVYFWLLDNGVMKTTNDDTPALICFYKEFGITVYKDTEPTPPADVRAVTTKNLLKVKGKITPDEKKRFIGVFSPYLIKK